MLVRIVHFFVCLFPRRIVAAAITQDSTTRRHLEQCVELLRWVVCRTLFWADQGVRAIECSSLSGTIRRTIVKHRLRWPNQLSFHHAQRYVLTKTAFCRTTKACEGRHLFRYTDYINTNIALFVIITQIEHNNRTVAVNSD